MNKENTQKLVKAFPHLYKDFYVSITQSCMPWGFDCGDGWFSLIWELSEKLSKYDVTASQVKEKYASLSYYINYGDVTNKQVDAIDAAVEEAYTKSCVTCELCGKKGKMNKNGWLSVLCTKCRKIQESK